MQPSSPNFKKYFDYQVSSSSFKDCVNSPNCPSAPQSSFLELTEDPLYLMLSFDDNYDNPTDNISEINAISSTCRNVSSKAGRQNLPIWKHFVIDSFSQKNRSYMNLLGAAKCTGPCDTIFSYLSKVNRGFKKIYKHRE